MFVKRKILFVLIVLVFLNFINSCVRSHAYDDTLRFVYITDLNLYPTPLIKQNVLEEKDGLLIYESQTIFHEIVGYINQKFDFDFNFVVFGGNNITNYDEGQKKENIWQLFLDIANQIESKVFFVFGENEAKAKNTDELTHILNSSGIKTFTPWWAYKVKNYLFIGLYTPVLFNDKKLSIEQLNWLKKVLLKNKKNTTIIFMHESVFNPSGKAFQGNSVKEFLNIVKDNPQIKLVFSGNSLLNRVYDLNKARFIISSSPIRFPCLFKLVEISNSRIKVQSFKVPLKGVVKKAEEYLVSSQVAKELFPSSSKSIVKYVLGGASDSNFEIDLRDR